MQNDDTDQKVISIAIPTYNGSEFLAETLHSILSQPLSDKVEVVLCDDRSTDATRQIAGKFRDDYDNVKLFENRENLGMDRNFEQVAAHATGKYVWFCGQDDIIGQGAIEKVLSILQGDSAIDFIYANYGQYDHTMKNVIADRVLFLDSDTACADAKDFLSKVGMNLPTFLPAYILRKSLWDRIDKKRFYGTQYIQVGVLLALLPDIKTYIVAHPYVKGRIPDDGWQRSYLKVLDIFTGYLEVITYYHRLNPDLITDAIYKEHFQFCWKNILSLIIKIRLEHLSLNEKLLERLPRIFSFAYLSFVKMLLALPSGFMKVMVNAAKMARGMLLKKHDQHAA